ncbi:transporter substrate-binding domain-containing protein [Fundidesulfovibrio soli]|uniref:transporter substrate-binding domain-containing protein n=1 Tax=Fundidesulfovibrio soli TaxID=2922716 RepID=UPI001FAFBBDA|nr:transporter substrate-binding domain-containing protein [Fundidesulfovibrio soli]
MTRTVSGVTFALAVMLSTLVFPAPGLCAEAALTDLERYYLEKEGDVALCVDPDWVPFESINEKGEHEGIAADLLKLVSERTGLRFRLVPTNSWEQSLDYSRNGRCQALSFLNETRARSEWLSFSEPIFTDVNVFITREEHDFISDPGGLVNETLVLPRGTSIEEFIRKDYPNIKVVIVESEADAFRMVSERKADMALRSMIMAAYTIKKGGWFNLKIAGQLPEYTNKLRVGLVKDKEKLVGIVNRGIRSISGQDRGAIVNRHVSINVQTVVDYSLLYKVSAVLLGVVALAGAWVWQLRRHNRELERISRTDALTGLANRTKLNAVVATSAPGPSAAGGPSPSC